VAILRLMCGNHPLVSIKVRSFWSRWQALICTGCMAGFLGLGKPSSPVTTSPNCTPSSEVVCWRGNEASV
jgi:hypothetical protein